MNIEVIEKNIKDMLPQKRYKHSVNVANCATKLSEIYGYNKEKAYIAGIAHDCAKYLNKEEVKYKNIDFEKWSKEAGKDFEIEDLGDNLVGVYLNGKHIATYNTKTQILMCDDTKLFGN